MSDRGKILAGLFIALAFFGFMGFVVYTLRNSQYLDIVVTTLASGLVGTVFGILKSLFGGGDKKDD